MKNIEKEKLYLIIIIIFLIIFGAGLVLYSHTNNPSLTKNTLSRIASFGPLWIFDKNESLSENKKYITKKNKNLKDNLPKKLFGVKILGDPKKYIYESAEGRENNFGGRLKNTWYRAKDIKNFVDDNFFDKYYFAVVDNTIAAIQANYIISDYLPQEDFNEACVDKRENYFAKFLKTNNIDREVFTRKYYKGNTKTKRIFYVDRISTSYKHKNKDIRLYFSCNYGFKLGQAKDINVAEEKINTTFIFRLSTAEHSKAGEEYTNYKSTKKFNEVYLKSISLDE